jgi:hypothetical protein
MTMELTTKAVRERLVRHLAKTGRKLECLDKSAGLYAVRSATGAIQYANSFKAVVKREGVLKGFESY